MFARSATTSFLPGAATIAPRTVLPMASITSSKTRSSAPAFSALMAVSTIMWLIVGRMRLPGWKARCAQRPVRAAPRNCMVPRSRPSLLTRLRRALNLALVLRDACNRMASSSRTASGRSGSSMRRSTVSAWRSGSVTPCASRM